MSDSTTRTLEREAASGDEEARRALGAHRAREGLVPWCNRNEDEAGLLEGNCCCSKCHGQALLHGGLDDGVCVGCPAEICPECGLPASSQNEECSGAGHVMHDDRATGAL